MSKQGKDLPDVKATKVDENGKKMKDGDGKVMKKTFPGIQWKLMGSNPVTNGGWKADSSTPDEIVETGNLTGATIGDGQGSGVDGKNEKASTPGNGSENDESTDGDDDDTVDVSSKI